MRGERNGRRTVASIRILAMRQRDMRLSECASACATLVPPLASGFKRKAYDVPLMHERVHELHVHRPLKLEERGVGDEGTLEVPECSILGKVRTIVSFSQPSCTAC